MKLTNILLGIIAVAGLQGCGDNYQGRYKASSTNPEVNFKLKGSMVEFMEIGDNFIESDDGRREVIFETVERGGIKYLEMSDEEGDVFEFKVINDNELRIEMPEFTPYPMITYTRVDD